jgi:RNA polymerase sigma-70 factor (ECF subfamily)
LRRRGKPPSDAEDLTQAFFARLLASSFLANARTERGRFRSYLLTALNHFVSDERDLLQAQKRGGGNRPIPLDLASAESRFRIDPPDNLTPERIYERQWVMSLLSRVFDELRQEYQLRGKEGLFLELQGCLGGSDCAMAYDELSERTHLSNSALRVTVHRMRQRFRDLLRTEIAQTVSDPSEVDDELRYLQRALAK